MEVPATPVLADDVEMITRMLSLFCGLVALAVPLQGADPQKAASYREVAVFPLPDRPSNEIAPLFAVLRETVSTGSRLEEIQRVLWLQQLSAKELLALLENFPNPWEKNAIPGYLEVDPFRLKEQIENALITHPENPELNDEALTAPLRAFQAARNDWGLALKHQPPEGDLDARIRYQDGLTHAIQCADSLAEAIAMHKALVGPRHNLVHSTLADAWPISEVWDYLGTLPVDTSSGWLPHLVPRGAWFFSEVETLREFSRSLSRHPGVISPRIGETMAPVMAARSTEQFFAWLNAQSGFHQKWAAQGAKKYFVRTGGAPLAKFYRRFPDLKDKPKKKIPWFNPATMDLHEHGEALIKQEDPKAVQFGAVSFGKRWGKVDGPVAFAWTMKNVPEKYRTYWLRMVLNGWAHKDPDAAGKAFASLDPELLNEARDGATMKNRDHQYTDRSPAVFRLPADLKGPAFPDKDGGTIDRHQLTQLVKSLELDVVPPIGRSSHGFPSPALNARAAAQILGMGKKTVTGLLGHLQSNPPTTARGMEVQRLVLERWALDDPRAASEWLVFAAPGSHRPVLPLSLSRLAIQDPETALRLSRKIPEEHLAGQALVAIARSIAASYGFPKAIELCGNAAGHTLSKTWLRYDKEAAEAWREANWLFD